MIKVNKMVVWKQRQRKKGFLTWQEYLEAVVEDETIANKILNGGIKNE